MDKSIVALMIINEYLTIFKCDNIDNLNKLPKIEKKLFDNHKVELDNVISRYIDKLHEIYKPKEISYYDRTKIKNYPYVIFKKLCSCNKINLKIIKQLKRTSNNSYSNVTYCHVQK